MKKRVAITGLGVVCPIGNNIAQFEAGLIAGKNGISVNNFQDTTGYRSRLLGQVKNLSYCFWGLFTPFSRIGVPLY